MNIFNHRISFVAKKDEYSSFYIANFDVEFYNDK